VLTVGVAATGRLKMALGLILTCLAFMVVVKAWVFYG
jgi:hypothetical protein